MLINERKHKSVCVLYISVYPGVPMAHRRRAAPPQGWRRLPLHLPDANPSPQDVRPRLPHVLHPGGGRDLHHSHVRKGWKKML